jgi:hypothetical protein
LSYGDPWQPHVWPVGHALSSAHVSDQQKQATGMEVRTGVARDVPPRIHALELAGNQGQVLVVPSPQLL